MGLFDQLKDRGEDLKDEVTDTADDVSDAGGDAGDAVSDAFGDLGSSAGDAVGEVQDTASGASSRATDAFSNLSESGGDFADDVADDVTDTGGDIQDEVNDAFSDFGDNASDAADSAGGSVKDAIDSVADTGSDAATDAFDTATDAPGAAADAALDVSGASEFAESDQAAKLRGDIAEADEEGGVVGAAKKFDAAAKAGFDYILDNPNASLQEAAQQGIEGVTGVDESNQGEVAAELGRKLNERYGDAKQGTALDNPVTEGAETVGEIFIAEPAKAAIRGTTGVSVDQGTTEGTVGAIDAFDVGVTIGTAGVGKAGLAAGKGAVKGSGEGATLASRLLGRGGDDAAAGLDEATGASDEAVRSSVEAAESGGDAGRLMTDGGLPRAADESVQTAGSSTQVLDEGAAAADEAVSVPSRAADATDGGLLSRFGIRGAGLADESGRLARFGRSSDELARTSDEAAPAADEAARTSDEAARGSDEAARGADDAAQGSDDLATLSDEAAQGADESPGLARRFAGSTTGKIIGGGAAALGAGALLESMGTFDKITVTDQQTGEKYALVREKNYGSTDRRDGGILWEVKTGNEQEGYTNSQGYTVMVDVQGRNVIILDSAGNRQKAQVPVETFQKAMKRAKGNTGGGGA
jgi:hypothetical protein